jgi:hypothetical protein
MDSINNYAILNKLDILLNKKKVTISNENNLIEEIINLRLSNIEIGSTNFEIIRNNQIILNGINQSDLDGSISLINNSNQNVSHLLISSFYCEIICNKSSEDYIAKQNTFCHSHFEFNYLHLPELKIVMLEKESFEKRKQNNFRFLNDENEILEDSIKIENLKQKSNSINYNESLSNTISSKNKLINCKKMESGKNKEFSDSNLFSFKNIYQLAESKHSSNSNLLNFHENKNILSNEIFNTMSKPMIIIDVSNEDIILINDSFKKNKFFSSFLNKNKQILMDSEAICLSDNIQNKMNIHSLKDIITMFNSFYRNIELNDKNYDEEFEQSLLSDIVNITGLKTKYNSKRKKKRSTKTLKIKKMFTFSKNLALYSSNKNINEDNKSCKKILTNS